MEIILNELSIKGQFVDEDEFREYVIGTLKKMLDVLVEKKIPLYKKVNIYDCKITQDTSFSNLLHRANDPAISIIKKAIVDLSFSEPYWDDDESKIQSKEESDYEYPGKTEEPNAVTEAMERDCNLLSFPMDDYRLGHIACSRNGLKVCISNIISMNELAHSILLHFPEEIRYVMEHVPYEKQVRLFYVENSCPAETALLNNDLTIDDMILIVDNIHNLIRDKGSATKTRWWDSIETGIFEYRTSVSNGRQFRLFFLWEKEVVFLNGFIKKTRTTPSGEKEKARKLKKMWDRSTLFSREFQTK